MVTRSETISDMDSNSITTEKRKIFKVRARGKAFTMISLEDITEDEAERFVSGKIKNSEIVKDGN